MRVAGLRRCVLCGSRRKLHEHHIGGQNHIPWLTMLLCGPCHETFHARFRQSVELPRRLLLETRSRRVTALRPPKHEQYSFCSSSGNLGCTVSIPSEDGNKAVAFLPATLFQIDFP